MKSDSTQNMHIKKTIRLFTATVMCGAVLIPAILSAENTIISDFEAESGVLENPMKVNTQNGVRYISTKERNEGKATFTFTLPTDGIYEIKGKTIASNTGSDSFTVSLDAGTQDIWDIPNSSDWKWNTIKLRNNNEATFKLNAGRHTLTLFGREANTMIDRIQVVGLSQQSTSTTTLINTSTTTNQVDTYYIDPVSGNDGNTGLESKPWKNIQFALNKAKPGTVIKLLSGTYNEKIETVVDGTKDKPITIEPALGAKVIFDFGWAGNAPRFVNSYYVFRNVEVRRFVQGIRIENAHDVVIENINLHHGQHECLRLRHFARNNTIRNNKVHFCGASNDTTRIDGGNGEGIYIGTAPEQRSRNDDRPDTSTGNVIYRNEVYETTEGVDVKEDSSYTVIEENHIRNVSDKNSGGINVRADNVKVSKNLSENNAGSGFRFGGDKNVFSPEFGSNHNYGSLNILRDNSALNNAEYGYKFMWGPQDMGCTNKASGNASAAFYFADGVENFLPNACK